MKTLTQENTPQCPKGNFPEVVTIRTYTWEGGKRGRGEKLQNFPPLLAWMQIRVYKCTSNFIKICARCISSFSLPCFGTFQMGLVKIQMLSTIVSYTLSLSLYPLFLSLPLFLNHNFFDLSQGGRSNGDAEVLAHRYRYSTSCFVSHRYMMYIIDIHDFLYLWLMATKNTVLVQYMTYQRSGVYCPCASWIFPKRGQKGIFESHFV